MGNSTKRSRSQYRAWRDPTIRQNRSLAMRRAWTPIRPIQVALGAVQKQRDQAASDVDRIDLDAVLGHLEQAKRLLEERWPKA